MKLTTLTTAGAAFLLLGSLASAQTGKVPDPAHPAPANPRATDGMSTEAPAKGGDMGGNTSRSMSRETAPHGGNPDNANGGNGPGGRY